MAEKKFEWLTEEICREYMERAKQLAPDDGRDVGPWRDLRIELQKRCDLTEVQAYNIIRGIHVREYVNMYGILSGREPMPEAMQKKLQKAEKQRMAEKLKEYEDRIEELESLKNGRLVRGSEFGFEEKD